MFKLTIALLAVVSVLALAGVASGSSVHFKKGSPVFRDVQLGTSCTSADEGKITASGNIAGLGNGNVLITVDVTPAAIEDKQNPCVVGTASGTRFSCTNPGEQDKVPGQNPATISGSLAIPANEIKNGTLAFSVSTLTTVPGAPGCPNAGWTQGVDALSAGSVTLTIKQAGVTVLGGSPCTPTPNPTNNNAAFTCP